MVFFKTHFLLEALVSSDSDCDVDDDEVVHRDTIMVPLADLLNHVPDHNAELKQGEVSFQMVAVKDIKKVCYCHIREICFVGKINGLVNEHLLGFVCYAIDKWVG